MKISVIVLGVLAVSGLAASPAWADKAAYCQAYARDFSDARATDKAEWQHKYDIALDACLGSGKKASAAKIVITPKTETVKPAASVATAQPKVAKPVPEPTVKPVAETAAPKLVVGSPEWNDYCTKKYTSFNTKTGMYLSRTGVARRCLVTPDVKG